VTDRLAPEAAPALRCSFASALRDDPVVGTAAPAAGMLLVEQPGPWGRRALVQSRLDADVGAEVSDRAVARGLRVLLIRRPGREVTYWGTFGDDPELLELPLDGSAGTSSYDPTFLICTHGRHDACCAIRGRPIAASLAEARREAVWECSHVGGDRFAANLVALPHGLYYGRVDEQSALDVVAAHERGEVVPRLLRGRTTFAPVAQAAQQHARDVLGEHAINALNPVKAVPLPGHAWDVRLRHEPADLIATVRSVSAGPVALLTCAALHTAHPPAFEVTDLRAAV